MLVILGCVQATLDAVRRRTPSGSLRPLVSVCTLEIPLALVLKSLLFMALEATNSVYSCLLLTSSKTHKKGGTDPLGSHLGP